MDDTSAKPAKPLLRQSGSEMASGREWAKAISEGRMPSRHIKARGR